MKEVKTCHLSELEIYQERHGNDRVVVFIGDSFTAGLGAYPDNIHDAMERSKRNYPHYFMKHLSGYDYLNLGMYGASNETIFDELVNAKSLIDDYDEVVVIFGHTSFNRKQIILPDYLIREMGLSSYRRDRFPVDDLDWEWYDRLHQSYQAVNVNYEQKYYTFFRILNNFQNHCNVNGYKFCVFPMFMNVDKKLLRNPPTELQMFTNLIDFEQHILSFPNESLNMVDSVRGECKKVHGDSTFLNDTSNHFVEGGYKLMADMLFDIMVEMNYFEMGNSNAKD